jgi:hypothetical protein
MERGGRGGGIEILFLRRQRHGRFALDGPARRR